MLSPVESPAGWLAFLDARLRAAVAAAVETDEDPDGLRGLYISDELARSLAAATDSGDPDARLTTVSGLLGLDALDSAVLGVCSAPELHPRYGRLYAYLQDDVTRRLASPRLAADLLAGEGVSRGDVLACFGTRGRLMRTGALQLLDGDANPALADRPVRVAERVAACLLDAGGGLAETSAPGTLRRVEPEPGLDAGRPATIEEIARLLQTGTRLPLLVCGPDAAQVVAAAAGRTLVVIGASEVIRPDALRDATLASALEGALLCVDGLGELGPDQRSALRRAIESRAGMILLARSRADSLACGDLLTIVVSVPMPSFPERQAAWARFTGSDDTGEVAAKFRLSIGHIREAAEVVAVAVAARDGAATSAADLDAGARHASSSRLGELATRLDAAYRWDDLVLPERQLTALRSISAYLRHRDRVLSEWGYERTVSRTQGLKVLFAGDSGTGKTMAAQVLAAELGLELFRVDLAAVVSKYIGETEKNLERIFACAEGSNAILFFDEADALFGKRTETSDAHDRYANIEVSYLLQRMEGYPGAVILATNFRANVDAAFARRLDFVIDFPFPGPDDRRRIWRLLLPSEAPLSDDVDLDALAQRFKLSGGAIRNCSVAAAFQAADEDTSIGMRHLARAVAQEYAKQGRLALEADFGPFHRMLGSDPTAAPDPPPSGVAARQANLRRDGRIEADRTRPSAGLV